MSYCCFELIACSGQIRRLFQYLFFCLLVSKVEVKMAVPCQLLCVFVFVCVCFHTTPYVKTFGRTVLYVCIEYCI